MVRLRNAGKDRHILEGNGSRGRKLIDGDVIAVQFFQEPSDKAPTRCEAIVVGDGAGFERTAVPLAAFRASVQATSHAALARIGKKKVNPQHTKVVFVDIKKGNFFSDIREAWCEDFRRRRLSALRACERGVMTKSVQRKTDWRRGAPRK